MPDLEHAQGEQLELVGLAEAAELLTMPKAALWERRGQWGRPGVPLPPFPTPLAELRCGPVWFRDQIVAYAQEAEQLASDRSCERFAEEKPALNALLSGLRLGAWVRND